MTHCFCRLILTFLSLALVTTLVAQTTPTDTTTVDSLRNSAMDVDMHIVVRVDSAQRGKLSDEEIARAVQDGIRRAFGIPDSTISPRAIPSGKAAGVSPLYERYLERQEKKGRHIERVPREDLNATFVPKGQWMFGGSIGFNEWDSDNLNYLVLKNIDIEGHTFSISPYFGYFVAKNICLGARFNYSRYYFNLGQFDLNLGEDFNISLSDLYYLEHNYDTSIFMRTYMPLGKSKVFGFFSEIDLTYGHSTGKNSTGSGDNYEGTMEHVNSIGIGFCPGLTAFATDFMAVECSVSVMGLQYKWKDQKTNQVETGKSRSGGANFKINLFAINLGMTFYL